METNLNKACTRNGSASQNSPSRYNQQHCIQSVVDDFEGETHTSHNENHQTDNFDSFFGLNLGIFCLVSLNSPHKQFKLKKWLTLHEATVTITNSLSSLSSFQRRHPGKGRGTRM